MMVAVRRITPLSSAHVLKAHPLGSTWRLLSLQILSSRITEDPSAPVEWHGLRRERFGCRLH